MAGNDTYFTFTYYDYDQSTGTYGDSYTGYGYGDEADGLTSGSYDYLYDYNGSFTGYYYIDYVYNYGADYGLDDTVSVTSYYDFDSGTTSYNITSYGTDLGTEYGYADSQYFNAYYNYEADFSSSSTNDVYYTFTYYDYDQSTGTYGDSYTGYGYGNEADGLTSGSYDYLYDYNGNFTGYYYIDYVYNYGADYNIDDTVSVTSYYDADSGTTSYNLTSYGTELGTEYGYADSQYFNAYYNYEADFSNSSTNDVYYTFTYYDYDQSTGTYGDSYTGYGYADEADGITTGTQYRYDYTGTFTGYYAIDYVYNYGVDYGYQGTIQVTSYYDADSGDTSYNVNTYGNGLGGEYGDAAAKSFNDYDDFNDYYNIEADFPTTSNTNDEYYTFTYYYANGDSFSGWGYADIGDDLFAGRSDNVYDSASNYSGYRYIHSTYEYSGDYGYDGQEYVDSYYDATYGYLGISTYSSWNSDNGANTFGDYGYRSDSPFVPNAYYFDYQTPVGL